MHNNSTASLQHMRHYSFKDLRRFLSSNEDRLDDILEKIMEAGTFIIVAALIYMVILAIYILNHANHAYASGLLYLSYSAVKDFLYSAVQGFI